MVLAIMKFHLLFFVIFEPIIVGIQNQIIKRRNHHLQIGQKHVKTSELVNKIMFGTAQIPTSSSKFIPKHPEKTSTFDDFSLYF